MAGMLGFKRPDAQKAEMVIFYGQAGRNYSGATKLFNEAYPERPADKTYLKRVVSKFLNIFTVKDAPRSGRPKVRTDDKQIDLLADVVQNPRQSVKKLAGSHEISVGTAHKILKLNKFHPFRTKLVHEINEDDPDRRLQFCEVMLQKLEADPAMVEKICFSDESTFFLNGVLNRHNCRYWSDSNPHEFREAHSQFPQKINVWAGILNDKIIGPFFIDGNLTGELYLQLLEDAVVPKMVEVLEELDAEFEPWFQQDGAPAHYALVVRNFLNNEFPQRWIGRRGFIEWPARSPDLTPCDFFLWGHLKSKVFETPPADIEELKQRITEECRKITPEMLQKVREEFVNRLFYCQEVNGAQFEHLI
ncbi:unnamed protein product [Bemisia tabaci]|uniref:DUF4817 domain-containing protein n=1 Tax=Bemisia tabaci TaxID=7038 RepID=A0A9P0AGS3_BEMTA|nr:unnamed protein product [Bemisia tabaci]